MNGSKAPMTWRCALTPEYVICAPSTAARIDTVLATAPGRLEAFLRRLQMSDERLAAWMMVDLALCCRDPLAPLATLCRDAVRAADDLDLLLHRPRRCDIEGICRAGHANAIFNLTEAARKVVDPHGACRERIRQLYPRLKIAAVTESFRCEVEIERIRTARQAALPNLWQVLADARVLANARVTSLPELRPPIAVVRRRHSQPAVMFLLARLWSAASRCVRESIPRGTQ